MSEAIKKMQELEDRIGADDFGKIELFMRINDIVPLLEKMKDIEKRIEIEERLGILYFKALGMEPPVQ